MPPCFSSCDFPKSTSHPYLQEPFVPFVVCRGTCSTAWAVPLHHLTAASFTSLRPIGKQLHKCKWHEPSLFVLPVFPCQADKTAYLIKNAVRYQEKVLLADFPKAATIRANYKALTLSPLSLVGGIVFVACCWEVYPSGKQMVLFFSVTGMSDTVIQHKFPQITSLTF